MTNPAEFPRLTDEALVDIVQEAHARKGRQALEVLVDRHSVAEAAELLDVPPERVEELL